MKEFKNTSLSTNYEARFLLFKVRRTIISVRFLDCQAVLLFALFDMWFPAPPAKFNLQGDKLNPAIYLSSSGK